MTAPRTIAEASENFRAAVLHFFAVTWQMSKERWCGWFGCDLETLRSYPSPLIAGGTTTEHRCRRCGREDAFTSVYLGEFYRTPEGEWEAAP